MGIELTFSPVALRKRVSDNAKSYSSLHTSQAADQVGTYPEKSKVIQLSSYVASVLYTARISTVGVIVSCDKWIKIHKLS